jgi:hypothetical protein
MKTFGLELADPAALIPIQAKNPLACGPAEITRIKRHGRFPHSCPARPQPVEPAYRHSGHRFLRGREVAIICPPGFEARLRERFRNWAT